MTHPVLALAFVWMTVLGSCQQAPPRPADAGDQEARYVDATILTKGDDYSGVQVLTAVPLRHISAADAEARLQVTLPAGARVSRVGGAPQLLIQGPGKAVRALLEELARLDVR